MRLSNRVLLLSLLASSAGLAACGGSGSGSSSALFTVRNTANAVAGASPVAFQGRVFVYFASEASSGAGGTDFNGDGDVSDSVAFVVDMSSRQEDPVGIAAETGVWLGEDVLVLVVDESEDGFDYDGDGDTSADDLSLVAWRRSDRTETFLGALPGGSPRVEVVGQSLYFSVELPAPPGAGSTTLRRVDLAAPGTVLPLGTTSPAPNGLTVTVGGSSRGLLHGTADEASAGADLNADGDSTDAAVLWLLDATAPGGIVLSTGLGLAGPSAAFDAWPRGVGDWRVAVLVSEAAHADDDGATDGVYTGFNDPNLFGDTWQPPQCDPLRDVDNLDQVLFWIDFAAFAADPLGSPPVNTGLVGRERVVALENHVATVSTEADDGGCDLNADGDDDDRVVRFVETTRPVLPANDQDLDILALAQVGQVPGGTGGLAVLDGRLVVLADEAADGTDYDGKLDDTMAEIDNRLLGWKHPDANGGWTFDHGVSVNGQFMSFFQGATWMQDTLGRNRLLVAVPESVEKIDLNFTSNGGDGDLDDSFPSFAFMTTEPRLAFPFVRFAVDADNAGIVLSGTIAYYRVSEAANGRDFNEDGDEVDFVLYRSSLTTGETRFMGTANNLDRPVIEQSATDADPFGAAFLASESAAGLDFNMDGDTNDFAWRWFRQ